ncbi:hypothetical protein OBBRIDRAFT_808065 [Obba rivulosa]|uniref:Uncharacterized protein n=1 Tax=Obba rivulosa TaxID=1052685 RepID=A0A8E2DF80_9APHY|nr:hypothetical protein OBBRIDRAFT_808065 [Obba rivulosa]
MSLDTSQTRPTNPHTLRNTSCNESDASSMQVDLCYQPKSNNNVASPVPGGTGAPLEALEWAQPKRFLNEWTAALWLVTAQVFKVAHFIGDPEGLWAAHRNDLSPALVTEGKSFEVAVALLIKRYFTLLNNCGLKNGGTEEVIGICDCRAGCYPAVVARLPS